MQIGDETGPLFWPKFSFFSQDRVCCYGFDTNLSETLVPLKPCLRLVAEVKAKLATLVS